MLTIRNKAKKAIWLDGDDTAAFMMGIKGGKLPNNAEFKIYVEFYGYKDATVKQLREYSAGGQSGRVVCATTIRTEIGSVEVCKRLERDGLRIHFSEVGNKDAFMSKADRDAILADQVSKMTPERKAALRALLEAEDEEETDEIEDEKE